MSRLSARQVALRYGSTQVLRDVTVELPADGGSIGLIGESGSGKSTLARVLLGLEHPQAGSVHFDGGSALAGLDKRALRRFRQHVQPVFQDGFQSLDPLFSVSRSLRQAIALSAEGNGQSKQWAIARATALLDEVGLDAGFLDRRPHELSGGQRQRVTIARALAVSPSILILDEPTSALDVTVQARILALLNRLKTERQLQLVLITHNIGILGELVDEIVVLESGTVAEHQDTHAFFRSPASSIGATLVASVPQPIGLD